MSITIEIKNLEMQGLEPCLAENHINRCFYCCRMAQTIASFPKLKDHIGEIVMMKGSGWAQSVYKTYALTFTGINELLRLNKINAVVANSVEKLKEAFADIKDRGAIIIDSGFLSNEQMIKNHAISLFLDKTKDKVILCINDSFGDKYGREFIKETYFDNEDISVIQSNVKRQERSEVTCYAFAIVDCIAFQDDSNLLERMKVLSPNKLPESLMSISTVAKAREKALEFQSLLIENAMKI